MTDLNAQFGRFIFRTSDIT